jgi:hypothetical protein
MGKAMTVGERRRADILKREIGCIPCKQDNRFNLADLHHLIKGYRLGHSFTVPICPWHHRAVPPDGPDGTAMRPSEAEEQMGPSLATNSKAFHDRYGSDEDLLWQADHMVAAFEKRLR